MSGADERMRFYVFTFGCAHPLHDRLQGVYATSETKAREVMISFYGTTPWCACYEVRELKMDELGTEAEVSLHGYKYRMIREILREGQKYK